MTQNYTIGSPVFAAQLNALIDRISKVAVYAPCTSSHSVVNVMGYGNVGAKVNPPGVGGVTYVPCNMTAPTDQTHLCVTFPTILQSAPAADETRPASACANVFFASSTVSGTSTATIVPTYGMYPQNSAPQSRIFPADVSALGSGYYTPNGLILTTRNAGDFGYEQDVLPFNAWIQVSGVADAAPSSD